MQETKQKQSASSSFKLTFIWVITIALFLAASKIEHQFLTTAGNKAISGGIISLEFVGSYDNFNKLVSTWKPGGTVWAAFLLGFDFFQIAAYISALFLTCQSVAKKLQAKKLHTATFIAMIMSVAVLLAGVFDIVENVLLMHFLASYTNSPVSLEFLNNQLSAAKIAAQAKFVIIVVVLVFISCAYFLIANAMKKTKKTLD